MTYIAMLSGAIGIQYFIRRYDIVWIGKSSLLSRLCCVEEACVEERPRAVWVQG